MNSSKFFAAFGVFVSLGLSLLSAWTAFTSPLAGYDSAFNLQVADSLRESFVYSPKYHPLILNPEITTNGLVQYLTALFIAVLGERLGLSAALGLFSFVMLISVLIYSKTAFLLVSLLFVSWRMMFQLSTQFLGEIFSLAMLIFMLVVLKGVHGKTPSKRLKEALIALAGVFLALAAQAKLLAGVVGVLIAVGFLLRSEHSGAKPSTNNAQTSLKLIAWSAVFFVGMYFFSYLHSVVFALLQSIEVDSSNLLMFALQHIYQGVVQGTGPKLPTDYLESSVVMIPLVIVSSLLLLSRSLSWSPLVLIALFSMFTSSANERRVFLFLAVLFILAAGEAKSRIHENGLAPNRRGLRNEWKKRILYYLLFLILISQLTFSIFTRSGVISMITPTFDRERELSYSKEGYLVPNEYIEIVGIIENTSAPIVASGWYQFPEIQLWSGKVFFDRMDRATPEKLARHQTKLLLFSPQILAWPNTPIELCGQVVYKSDELVLCEFNSELPLDYQG